MYARSTTVRGNSQSLDDATVCLLAVERDRVGALGELARELAVRGVVTRVEAEPHL